MTLSKRAIQGGGGLALGLRLAACTPASNAPGAKIRDFATDKWCQAVADIDWAACGVTSTRSPGDIDNGRVDATLGRLYAEGTGVPKDEDRAFHLFSAGAKLDDPDSLNGLGECYEKEWGVARDDGKAVMLFVRAVSLGNVRALNNLGRMLEQGRGTQPDLQQARELYERGAAAGDKEAAVNAERLKPAG
jgi:TPR repeat protein